DVVITWRTGSYDVDDIIVYSVPDGDPGEGHLVVHRITGETAEGALTTRGDNKTLEDPWTPATGDVVGEHLTTLPAGLTLLKAVPYVMAALAGLFLTMALWNGTERRTGPHGPPPARRPRRWRTIVGMPVLGVIVWVGGASTKADAATLGG